jgi:hypothetical protein
MTWLIFAATMALGYTVGLYLGFHWYTVIAGFGIGIAGGYVRDSYNAGKWL